MKKRKRNYKLRNFIKYIPTNNIDESNHSCVCSSQVHYQERFGSGRKYTGGQRCKSWMGNKSGITNKITTRNENS